jgi:hypothetical protein
MPIETSWLSVCPRIESRDGQLIGTTSGWVRFLSLGLLSRRVVVDGDERLVQIVDRRLWFFRRTRTYFFGELSAVTYGYEHLGWLGLFSPGSDGLDRFVVGLKPAGRDEVRLFNFVGEGTFTNQGDLPDWWYRYEYAWDWAGTQEGESRLYARLLSKMVGVSLEPSRLTE